MRIKDKIHLDYNGLIEHGPINIVAFGDSVTHGAFECDVFDYESVYWSVLRKKILEVKNYVPVNVIDAGIAGITAKASIDRIDSQAFAHNPDLIIICFGLNDINGSKEDYLDSLKVIFRKCLEKNTETIFMTPNMLNTYASDDTDPLILDYARVTCEYQNSGKMDEYIYAAVNLAEQMGVKVCDCYSMWKELSKTQDITKMLANRINHPTREMHNLFADSIFDIIFDKKQ